MGPIEIVFLAIFALFGGVGLVRTYQRELGVTTMLFITLFVLEFASERYEEQLKSALSLLVGTSPAAQADLTAGLFCVFLLVMTFVSYQGITLNFPGSGKNTFFSLGAGLLNGYLVAGSLWYYLDKVQWLFLNVQPPYSQFYQIVVKYLPPAIFTWQYLIGLAVFMLIVRIWK